MSNDERLHALAAAAGVAIHWTDADGQPHKVPEDVLRRILAGLELPADSDAQTEDSLARLRQAVEVPPLLTLEQHQHLDLSGHFSPRSPFELTLEDGRHHAGRLDEQGRAARGLVVHDGFDLAFELRA